MERRVILSGLLAAPGLIAVSVRGQTPRHLVIQNSPVAGSQSRGVPAAFGRVAVGQLVEIMRGVDNRFEGRGMCNKRHIQGSICR